MYLEEVLSWRGHSSIELTKIGRRIILVAPA
jgi:hypothetical protein